MELCLNESSGGFICLVRPQILQLLGVDKVQRCLFENTAPVSITVPLKIFAHFNLRVYLGVLFIKKFENPSDKLLY